MEPRMFGTIEFHVLRDLRDMNSHARHGILNNLGRARILSPISYADRLDVLANILVRCVTEKFERGACVCIWQSEDDAFVVKRVKP